MSGEGIDLSPIHLAALNLNDCFWSRQIDSCDMSTSHSPDALPRGVILRPLLTAMNVDSGTWLIEAFPANWQTIGIFGTGFSHSRLPLRWWLP